MTSFFEEEEEPVGDLKYFLEKESL